MDATDAVVWVHLDYGEPGAEDWIRENGGMDPATLEALISPDPRPRCVLIGDGLFVVLRGINLNDGSAPEDMVSLRLWIQAKRMVSVRRRRVRVVAELSEQLIAGNGPRDVGDLLVQVVVGINERISAAVGGLDDQADALEEAMLTVGSRELRSRIGALRRDAIALRRYIAPQREAVSRLQSERVSWLSDLDRARLREAADRLTRCFEDLDSARDRAAVTQEELTNRIAEQMNGTMYVLSVVAAIFLPLGLLTGLLGINVGGMPGVDSPYAFAIVCIILVALGVGLALYFRRRRLI
ncbi:MAG: zinc transporter [Myxococcota bacterium]|jgi:zinc transporter